MADDLRQYFVAEARELVEQLMMGVLQAERGGPLTTDQRRHLLRLAHTLKGAARVVRETTIGDAAHAMEDLLSATGERLDAPQVSQLLGLIDIVTAALPEIRPAAPVPPPAAATPPAEEVGRAVRVDLAEIDGALERAADLTERCAALQLELAAAGVTTASSAEGLATEVAELRNHLHQMRLAPASSVFVAVERAIRDAAYASGLLVRFVPSGGDLRLDADVLGPVRDALIQLVRNAVAHGIEAPAQRASAGKPPEGLITLTVERRGADMAFTVADDGRGLDLAGLRRAALAAGHAEPLGEHRLIDLLLAGGLTTRPAATQISGRGVGLDLVRSVGTRLQGRVSLRNTPGAGIEVELLLPVSLRSLRYLRLETGSAAALLPLDAIRGTVRMAEAARVVLDGAAHLAVDGAPLPVYELTHVLASSEAAPTPRVAALVATGTGTVALAAERFGEADVTIVRALPALSSAGPVIRGVAVDANGGIVPVLEPLHLAAAGRGPAAPPPTLRTPHILVVDDSVTTRMLEQSILETAGFRVDTAASAEDALRCAAETTYDLFIVDVEMPGMSGFEFVAAARADGTLARIPAILVTSRASEQDRRRGADAGAQGYIVKGEFDQEVFLGLVRRLVG